MLAEAGPSTFGELLAQKVAVIRPGPVVPKVETTFAGTVTCRAFCLNSRFDVESGLTIPVFRSVTAP